MARIDQEDDIIKGHLRVGPETAALLGGLSQIVNTLYDLEVIRNAATFATVRRCSILPVTNYGQGVGVRIRTNQDTTPEAVYIRAEAPGVGQTCELLVDTDGNNLTRAKATIVREGTAPEAVIVLLPSQQLWVDIITSAGSTPNVIFAAFPLRGRASALGGA